MTEEKVTKALKLAQEALHMATLPFPIDQVKTQRALEAVGRARAPEARNEARVAVGAQVRKHDWRRRDGGPRRRQGGGNRWKTAPERRPNWSYSGKPPSAPR